MIRAIEIFGLELRLGDELGATEKLLHSQSLLHLTNRPSHHQSPSYLNTFFGAPLLFTCHSYASTWYTLSSKTPWS